jgi:hypothetical protein
MTEDKENLIKLVLWYRDSYFQKSMYDFCTEIIEDIKNAKNKEELDGYECLIDSWLDNNHGD